MIILKSLAIIRKLCLKVSQSKANKESGNPNSNKQTLDQEGIVMIDPAFELGEYQEFIGQYTWRLKEGELRYRGSNKYAGLVNRRIPVSQIQLDSFIAALNLLEVWNWRDDYTPIDVGIQVEDGGQWWFRASLDDRECQSGGWNAFPSYSDPTTTSLSPQCFALLRTCLYDSFDIDVYIQQAQMNERQTNVKKNDQV